MKNKIFIIYFIFALACLSNTRDGFCREKKGNLYDAFRKEPVVYAYIDDIVNASDSTDIDTVDLKQKLTSALNDRKSINFEVVKSKEDADICVECDVTKFYWRENDPIDMITGAGAIAYDAITSDNYAYQEAVFEVKDAGTGKALWEKKLKIDLTRKQMSVDESIPLINEKTVKVFMRDCFSKGRSQGR